MKTPQRTLLFLAFLFQITSAIAHADGGPFGYLTNPLTMNFGHPLVPKPLSTTGLRLVVWNLHKGEDSQLPADFQTISKDANLSLVQEIISDPSFMTAMTQANQSLGWTLATSWRLFDSNFTGVATGSQVAPLREEEVLSNVTEPISFTPKAMLISEFALEGRTETLLVANVHGINFVTMFDYRIQIRQLFEKIRSHQGPLLIAGDFNTWNDQRLLFVQSLFAPLGIKTVQTPVTGDFFSLDHIFVRGLALKTAYNLNSISSSDHKPLLVDLTFEGGAK